MRISDWSSDVCSSDLRRSPRPRELPLRAAGAVYPPRGPDFPEARVCAAWGAVTRRTVSSGCHPREGGEPWDDLAPASPMDPGSRRSEEHTSELQSLMSTTYTVFCLKNKKKNKCTSSEHA